jgi:hypothetical protein
MILQQTTFVCRRFAKLPNSDTKSPQHLRVTRKRSSERQEADMMFLWIALAVWLGAALLLPVYMLFKAMFRNGRRSAARMEQARFARFARGY